MDQTRTPAIQSDEGHHAAELLELGDAFFELDAEWRIIRVNRNQERLSQRPREETLGRVFWEVWPETADPGGPYWREYHRCMEQRVPVQFEAYFQALELWTGVTAYPVSTGGIAVFFRDISAQKRAERALHAEYAFAAAVLDTVANVVVVLDRQGQIVRVNGACKRLTGYAGEELIGRAVFDVFIPADELAGVREAFRELRAGQFPNRHENRWRMKDGSERTLEWDNTAIVGRDGEVEFVIATGVDITDRRRDEQRVREAERQYRSLAENAPEVIARFDRQLRHTYVNEYGAKVYGVPARDVIGKTNADLGMPAEKVAFWERHFEDVFATGEQRTVDFEFESPTFGAQFFSSLFVAERDDAGAVVSVLAITRDVTKQKLAERGMRETQESLRAREEDARAHAAQLEAILDAVADGVVVYDREGRTVRSTRAADEMLGLPVTERAGPVQDRIGRQYEILDERGRRVPAEEMIAYRAAVRGEAVRGEVLSVRPIGGHPRWLRMNAVPFFLGGRHAGAVLSMTDVSERKRAEEALRESREQLRAAHERLRAQVESTPLALVEWDAEFRVAGYSPRAEELFGWSRDEVLGRRIDEIPWVPEEDWLSVRAVMRDMSSGARSSNVNANRNLRKDGEVIACEWYSSTLHDEAGHLVSVLSLVLDVTARERALASLRESEARLRLALEAGRLVAWEFDPVTSRVTPTENAAVVLAIQPGRPNRESAHGHSIIHPEDVERHRALVDAAVEGAGSYVSVYRQIAEDGGVLWVEERGRALTDASGHTVRLVGVTQDVTERKRAEEALREANEKLREADRRKDEFLGMLSHELRNPLAPIRNALYILDRAAPAGGQERRAKEVANRQIAHMTRLVDDLLDVTRIARGKVELRRADLDVAALAHRTAEDQRALMHDRRQELEVELPPAPVIVNADETRLAQVLGNLLHNAAKFTPAGGRIVLAVKAEGGRAVIRVRDTGPGIAPDVLPTIFEPFTQAKQTLARSEGGLGLGLALVKGLVAMHGGEVRALTPAQGQGTEFVVILPLAEETRATAREPNPGVVRQDGTRRVLVIDDNRDAADTIAELVAMLGHRVEVAYDAHDGLAKVAVAVPDVVLCDIGLPGMDGYEFARRFRTLADRHSVRLVAVSGYAQPEDVAKALEAGFDAHVAKPPDPDRLAGLLS